MRKIAICAMLALFIGMLPAASFAFEFGYVDAGKLFANYSETKKTKGFLESEKAKMQRQLDQKKKVVSDLDTKYVQIAKKIQDLRDSKKESAARKLEPQLRAQREALAKANGELQKFFESSQRRLYKMEEKQMGSLSKALDERVDKVIAQVAARYKLKAVFEKRFCYFGGKDITEAVLSVLNKGKKTAKPKRRKR